MLSRSPNKDGRLGIFGQVLVLLKVTSVLKAYYFVIRYCNENDAKEAVRKLHNYRIRLSIHSPLCIY